MDAVRQLDRNLFEAYIEKRADPIAGSLEPGIYAGYFDWRDCQTPTGNIQPGFPSLCVMIKPGVLSVTTEGCNHPRQLQQPLTNLGIIRTWHGKMTYRVCSDLCCCGSHVSCVKYGPFMFYCKNHGACSVSLLAFDFSCGCLALFSLTFCSPDALQTQGKFNAQTYFILAKDLSE